MNIPLEQIVVVIPVYKNAMTREEAASLRQCLRVLKRYDICLMTHQDLDLSVYKTFYAENDVPWRVEYFEKQCFGSVQQYNALMLSLTFYERFRHYRYMLIYQLDAYVFSDQLKEWCDKGYDYVGAPWMRKNKQFHHTCGNGGLSLRHIDSIIQLLSLPANEKLFSLRGLRSCYRKGSVWHKIKGITLGLLMGARRNSVRYFIEEEGVTEDVFYSAQKFDRFRIPDSEEAMWFAFERYPSYLFQLTGGQLPFGCHAWHRFEYEEFWRTYITIS